ncbi:MAG: DNA adenine methylase [Chloroflexia bacterium]|nr:DNA adenine methylase [Chloroflexia bacterium]
MALKAPFPYFGGKSRIADAVWARLGDVRNYIEPFFGSGAILLARPAEHTGRIETINDLDGFVANFWRALQHDPDAVAHHADNPVNECDLHARHYWLVQQRQARFEDRLMGDPEWYDAKIAGWWLWGTCAWIGGAEIARGKGPWQNVSGLLEKVGQPGISKGLPRCGNGGQGINTKTDLPRSEFISSWMQQLAERMRDVRVACGDWSRITGAAAKVSYPCGIVLDPPYAVNDRSRVYSMDDFGVSAKVREYAIETGKDEQYRIALFGYEGEHVMPESWECLPWKAAGGYGRAGSTGEANSHRERVWFSPGCLKPGQMSLTNG